MIAVLGVGAALLLAMIGVSWYGWITLPADARVPIHFGASYNNFVPKRLGLIIHPAVGALVYVIVAVAIHRSTGTSPGFIVPLVMCVLLIVQVGAVKVARGRSGPAS
jgi:hypothetical protein